MPNCRHLSWLRHGFGSFEQATRQLRGRAGIIMPGRAAALQRCAFGVPPWHGHVGVNPPLRYWKRAEHSREFPSPGDTAYRRTRAGRSLHSRQLIDIRGQPFLEIEKRSALGLSWVYNRLPNDIVMVVDVKVFQRNLQQFMKYRMTSGYAAGRMRSLFV